MTTDKDWMLVEFEGTYTIAHPDGIKGQKVLRPFHCKVEMEKEFLSAYSLRGVFATYYMEQLRKQFPNMIDLYRFKMVEATEVDGSKINNPRAMNHADLLQYIADRKHPINTSFYDDQQLRHEIALYESDPKGQQKLQGNLEKIRGGHLAVSKKIRDRGVEMQILPASDEDVAVEQKAAVKAAPKVINQAKPVAAKKAQTSEDLLDDLMSESAYATAQVR